MAKLTFVLIALAACVAGSMAQACGKTFVQPRANRVSDGGRIVGGMEAKPNSLPYQVSLQQYGYAHFCGGTLIRVGPKEESDIIVTAAHCIYDGASGITVTGGAHNLDYLDYRSSAQTSEVTKAVYHPQYNPDTTLNDIAILKLKTPIKFTQYVQPACLPGPDEELAPNTVATVSGWGHTREGAADTSKLLMQVGVPVVSHKDCSNSYAREGMPINQTAMLCAGYAQGGKDSCQGDSGGPFVVRNAAGANVLHGVVSFGIGCARPGLPGVYAKVRSYLPWINQEVRMLSTLAG